MRGARNLLVGGLVLLTGTGTYLAYAGDVGANALLQPASKARLRKAPQAYGWRYRTLRFAGHDGVPLVGWYVPAARPTREAVMLLHGHRSNKDHALAAFGPLLHDRYNILAFDARFHGDSGGPLTTLGWHERRDAALALLQLRALGNERIGVAGQSMGAAVAIGLAADRPEVVGVWADSPFDSLHGAVAPRAAMRGYPLAGLVALSVVGQARWRTGLDLEAADPIRAIPAVAPRPVFLVHGALDPFTPPTCSERLHAASRRASTLWILPEVGHVEAHERAPHAYRHRLLAFWLAAFKRP